MVNRAGRLCLKAFGQVDDYAVSATLSCLIEEPPATGGSCDSDTGCPGPPAE